MDYNLLMNYLLCFVAGIGIFFFFMRDFFQAWFQVKCSGGRKVLVKIRNPTQVYFRAGRIDTGMLRFNARKRPDNPNPGRSIALPKKYNDVVYKAWGVMVVEVDDVKNCILYWDGESYEAVSGFNAELHDEIVRTALAKPSLLDGFFSNKMFQLIVIGSLLILGVLVYMQSKQLGTLDSHIKLVYDDVHPIYEYIFNGTAIPKV